MITTNSNTSYWELTKQYIYRSCHIFKVLGLSQRSTLLISREIDTVQVKHSPVISFKQFAPFKSTSCVGEHLRSTLQAPCKVSFIRHCFLNWADYWLLYFKFLGYLLISKYRKWIKKQLPYRDLSLAWLTRLKLKALE